MSREERDVSKRASVLLAAALAVTVLTTRDADWRSVELFLLLLVYGVCSDSFGVSFRGVRIAGSFVAIALAMCLLGPGPAVVTGIVTVLVDAVRVRLRVKSVLVNLATYATFPLLGGLAVRVLGGPAIADDAPFAFAALAFSVFLAANFLNFLMVIADMRNPFRRGMGSQVREMFLPVVPVQVASGLLASLVVFTNQTLGLRVVGLLFVVGLVFQILLNTTFESNQRGEQLERRGRELAALQVGLLSTVMQTLSLRDKMTARHSAAVARYARAVALEVGASTEEADVIHTAGLLHDIGKFIFPDSILFADRRLTELDMAIVRQHPEQGAKLVRKIDGYGPVADIILAHHERIDGGGYPYGVPGRDIPLGARIISICDTYDVMTSRDSYRHPVSREVAFAELRRVSGAQLDKDLVEVFIDLVTQRRIGFRHIDDKDFERELNFDQRVLEHALPRTA